MGWMACYSLPTVKLTICWTADLTELLLGFLSIWSSLTSDTVRLYGGGGGGGGGGWGEFTIHSSLSGVNTSADNVYAELTINARRGEGECSLLVCMVYLA